MAEFKIDRALEELIDLELAKPAKCAYYRQYHDDCWRSVWADQKDEVIRRESFNDIVGYEIQLPHINVIIASYQSSEYSQPMYKNWKVMVIERHILEELFLTPWTYIEEKEDD